MPSISIGAGLGSEAANFYTQIDTQVVIIMAMIGYLSAVVVYSTQYWLHAKLALVVPLIAYHFYCGYLLSVFKADKNTYSHTFYRWLGSEAANFYTQIDTQVVIIMAMIGYLSAVIRAPPIGSVPIYEKSQRKSHITGKIYILLIIDNDPNMNKICQPCMYRSLHGFLMDLHEK
jgi:hypothetical protein